MLTAKSVNYSSQNDVASTVRHYSSLSVDEQFHLVWPPLLMGLFAASPRVRLRRQKLLAFGINLVSFLFLAFCIWFTYTNSSQAYFLTPTRMWEFSVGGLAAIAGKQGLPAWPPLTLAIKLALAGDAPVDGLRPHHSCRLPV